jgi:hypothetical protein
LALVTPDAVIRRNPWRPPALRMIPLGLLFEGQADAQPAVAGA